MEGGPGRGTRRALDETGWGGMSWEVGWNGTDRSASGTAGGTVLGNMGSVWGGIELEGGVG